MFQAPEHPTLVPFDGSFVLDDRRALAKKRPSEATLRRRLDELAAEVEDLQRRLYADDRWATLAVFQGRDAAGKDGTIRTVFRLADPAAVHVKSFQRPSTTELQHDFLWRTSTQLPERGHIGIFNRSYYEEVLVVRVHPEYLTPQRLPTGPEVGESPSGEFWQQRYESIRDHEAHLARSGTAIVKFFLNVSFEEQRRRFLERLDDPAKHWKFEESDVRDRGRWNDYTQAYEEAIAATSRPWAPWYVIPADDKLHMRVMVAEVMVASLGSLDLRAPEPLIGRPIEEVRAMLVDDRPG